MKTETTAFVPDLAAVKARQQATWSTGDFGRIGVRLSIVGETLAEAVDLRSTERVIDVAAGNGNASLAAARRLAEVMSTDYVPALLEDGLRRAIAEGLILATRVADAEDLPFDDGSFDVALSTFGVMFAPDAPKAASELIRVVRPGGRIGLASWTPDGFVGELFKTTARFAPPPKGVLSPFEWGRRETIDALFGAHASACSAREVDYVFRDVSARHFVDAFRRWYGPTNRAFAALDAEGQAKLEAALLELLAKHDRGGGNGLVVPATYLEVVIHRSLS